MRFDNDRFVQALQVAARAHAGQTRKGSSIPYLSHPLQVAGLVLEYGGTLDQAIAGLLHDTLEDSADITFADLKDQFGDDVAQMVQDCTDTQPDETPDNKRPWRERKQRFIAHLASVSAASALVCACDKLHNLGSLVADLRSHGTGYLDRFSAGPQEQLWYFRSVLDTLAPKLPAALSRELQLRLASFRRQIDGPLEAAAG